MYQTGGLFHPLLSQRIYQSNQDLKLSAKAFQLPKGTFIWLKSRGQPSDRGLICSRRGAASSLEGPTGWSPPTLSSTSMLSLSLSFSDCTCHGPIFKCHHLNLWVSADRSHQAPELILSEPIRWPSLRSGCQALTGTLMVMVEPPPAPPLSLLFSDISSCSTVMAISAACLPGCAVLVRAMGCGPVGQEGLNWGECCHVCYVFLLWTAQLLGRGLDNYRMRIGWNVPHPFSSSSKGSE